MRGQQERSGSLFSYVSIEERIPAHHPLRRIRQLAYQALDRLNPTFCQLYASEGRPSVPPEQLLLASLLQAFYGIRSERLLLEQLHYNLLFRWFVGLSPDDPIWHPTTFTKNRDRLLNEAIMGKFLEKLVGAPEVKPLLSDEHFSVDGTLLQAWATHFTLARIDGQDDQLPTKRHSILPAIADGILECNCFSVVFVTETTHHLGGATKATSSCENSNWTAVMECVFPHRCQVAG